MPQPAPPPPTNWMLDFELGVPKLESGELRAVGALDAGLAFGAFGGALHASGGYYDFASQTAIADWTRAEGNAEGWWTSGTEASTTRFEVRLSGGGSYYDTTYTGTTTAFTDETSTMGRGSVLVGADTHPSEAFDGSLLAGGGLQIEDHSELKVPGAASQGVVIDDSLATTLQASFRLDARWHFVPRTVSLALHTDGIWFAIRRSDDSIRVLSGSTTTTGTVSEYRQLELHGRLALEIDALAFAEVKPGVFGGADAFVLSGNAGTVDTLIPVAGVTLARSLW
jgi:hypothetical protein